MSLLEIIALTTNMSAILSGLLVCYLLFNFSKYYDCEMRSLLGIQLGISMLHIWLYLPFEASLYTTIKSACYLELFRSLLFLVICIYVIKLHRTLIRSMRRHIQESIITVKTASDFDISIDASAAMLMISKPLEITYQRMVGKSANAFLGVINGAAWLSIIMACVVLVLLKFNM